MGRSDWILSPSDFAFLWEECPRCFYLKIAREFRRPPSPFPKIFGVIDNAMKLYFGKKHTREVMPFLPGGIVEPGDHWVQSSPIAVSSHASRCVIRGKMDTYVRFDDGGHAILDFKTSEIRPDSLALYARQLHAYAFAVENPVFNNLALKPVTKLGLVVFEPDSFRSDGIDRSDLSGSLVWREIPRDDGTFIAFLDRVLQLLELPEPPAASAKCDWCRYRDTSRQSGL